MRINSASISVDTPLRISGASFVLGKDTDNYFGFVQGGAGMYGFTLSHDADNPTTVRGTVGLRIKGAWATTAIDISNTEIKSFLTHNMQAELNATKGLKFQKSFDFTALTPFSAATVYAHNLGYIPMVTITHINDVFNDGNVAVVEDLTTTSIKIKCRGESNFGSVSGKVYLW